MELHKAIAQAYKLIPKGKDVPGVLRGVRLYRDGVGSWVHATDGEVGCLVPADQYVPDVVLDADNLTPVMRNPIESVRIEGNTSIFNISDDYRVVCKPVSEFPPVPPVPTKPLTFVHGWFDVSKVFAMAVKAGDTVGSEGVSRPDLECVNFKVDRVEATDTTKIGVADISTPLRGLVPAKVFKGWPLGAVSVGSTDTHAWFKVGEVWFYSAFRFLNYAHGVDLRSFVPEVLEAGIPCLYLDTQSLTSTVKKALDVSDDGWVSMVCGESIIVPDGLPPSVPVVVKGESFEGVYECTLNAGVDLGSAVGRSIVVSGKLLHSVLKSVDTPVVGIYFCSDGSNNWLRLESGSVSYSVYGRVTA